MSIRLYDHQLDALEKMRNGCILNGGVGSGKSITSIAYYYLRQDGDWSSLTGGDYLPMGDPPKDLYIITTAQKRDKMEWEGELIPFLLSTHPEENLYSNKVIVDSWNNIKKYAEVVDAFFIFDEQRVCGTGVWVKTFLKICKRNEWILLSATPGDTWQDYVPVFIANGFYRNRTEFNEQHVVFKRFSKFPQIDRYLDTGRLIRLRNRVLIPMKDQRMTVAHHEDIIVSYNLKIYHDVMRQRWDIWNDKPIESPSELCYCLRKIVNTDESRQVAFLELMEKHPKAIVFYNFDYELDILKELARGAGISYAEWNGHRHQEIPDDNSWIYLVQYTAGNEGWNCIKTDTIIFWSQNYSYKVMTQAAGRIDRLNSPYVDLYYYHMRSRSGIDLAISRALKNKKKFNETGWVTTRK